MSPQIPLSSLDGSAARPASDGAGEEVRANWLPITFPRQEDLRRHKLLFFACAASFLVHFLATAIPSDYSESLAYLGIALALLVCAVAAGKMAFHAQGTASIRWGMFILVPGLNGIAHLIAFWTTLPNHLGNPVFARVSVVLTAIRITVNLACLSVAVASSYRIERALDIGVAVTLCALHFMAMRAFGTSFVLLYASVSASFVTLLALVAGYAASPEEKPFFRLVAIYLGCCTVGLICANQIGFSYFHQEHTTFWTMPYVLGLLLFPLLVAGQLERPASVRTLPSSNLIVRSLLPFTTGYAVVALSALLLKAHPVIGWCGIVGGISAFVGRTVLLHIRLQREMALLAVDNQSLTSLASRDFLTGLANRRIFQETFERVAEQGRRGHLALSVLLIDVDDFKGANDSFGHMHGDNCLMAVAETLRAVTAGRSASVARFGGDEFVVLLPGFSSRQALSTAQTLGRRIRSLRLAGRDGYVTVSIGVATGGCDLSMSAYLRQADAALYQVKDHGGNSAELFVSRSGPTP